MAQPYAIEAIPTRYKGTMFRSKTEARWAVFLDALGITWRFEAEGYKLPSGQYYQPDFRLYPGSDTRRIWLEVKGYVFPEPAKTTAEDKIRSLAIAANGESLIVWGSPDFTTPVTLYERDPSDAGNRRTINTTIANVFTEPQWSLTGAITIAKNYRFETGPAIGTNGRLEFDGGIDV